MVGKEVGKEVGKALLEMVGGNNPLGALGFYCIASIFIVGGNYTNEPLAVGIGLVLTFFMWFMNLGTYLVEQKKAKKKSNDK